MSTRRRLAVSLVAAAAAAGAVPLFVGSPASSAQAPAQCPSTPSYDYTMPTAVGAPAAVSLSGGVAGYAALGADKKLYYNAQDISSNPLLVTQLGCLGGQATDAPAVIQNLDGGLAFFVRAASGRIYYRFVASPFPTTGDTDYSSIGSFTPITNAIFTGGVGAVQTPDGVYHIFGRGTNGALYHGFRQAGGTWRFENLGGSILGQPAVALDGNRVLVAVSTPSGAIYTKRGTSFAWGPYVKVLAPRTVSGPAFTTVTSPSLVANTDSGLITLYAVGSNQGLYRLSKLPNAAFPSSVPWERIDTVLPAGARIAAAESGSGETGDAIVYASWFDKATNAPVAAYTQFLPGQGWLDYALVPYGCFSCAADSGVSPTAQKTGQAKVGGVKVKGTKRTEVLDSQKK